METQLEALELASGEALLMNELAWSLYPGIDGKPDFRCTL